MDLKRYQEAWARNAIPKQTLDDQEKIVLQDRGTVKADQGTLQADQVQLGFTNITSPITGRVGLRLVDPGNLAQRPAPPRWPSSLNCNPSPWSSPFLKMT